MKKQRDLAEALYCIVMCAVMIGFAFAAGVWAGENQEQPAEPQPTVEVVWVKAPKVEENADAGTLGCTRDDGAEAKEDDEQVEPDPMIEDTFLREDIPLEHDLQVLLYGACQEMGVDYDLAVAVIDQETDFRNLMGDGGKAYGYFQIWPKWHRDRMAELGVTDLMDPESNFRVGCHFLAECIDKYGLEAGLGYYNSGRAAVTDYSREVLEVYCG